MLTGDEIARRKIGRAGAFNGKCRAVKADKAALRAGVRMRKEKKGKQGKTQHGSLR
jgi:hypothetical protein